ncbi:hypothetical protein EJB05_12588, partial [Eragrostis curvula]
MQHRLPSPLPCLAFNDGTFVSLPNDGYFHFPDTVRYHSSYGQWLVFSCDDGACYLKNPFSKVTLKLPHMSCLCPIEEPVKIINGRSYTMFEEDAAVSVGKNRKMLIVKVIVCSNLLIAAIVSLGCVQTVALCQPGKLYVINAYKDLSVIYVVEDNDTGKLSISRIERLIETPYATHAIWDGLLIGKFLVESQGALLLIPVCKMAEAEHPTSWSDLPTDLADLVLCRLPAYSDRVCFGAVCRHWNYSLKQHRLPPPLPCLMFSDGTLVSLPGGESFQFCDSTKYHSSCGEWLVFSRDGTCSVMNPFSKISLTLPNLSYVRFIDEPVQIINGHATQNGDISQQSLCMDAELTVQKVIVGSVLLVAAIVDIEPLSHTVALCRPGADSWLVSEFGSKRLLMDMLFVEGKLYAIDEYMDFWAIDVGQDSDSGKLIISRIKCLIDSPSVTVSLIQNGVTSISYFLVESHGAQLLIPICRMAQAQHLQSWSDLPTELAGLVLCRLPSYSDRVRFGAVCCHWSFSSAQHCLPPPLPCLAFPDGTFVCLPLVESFQFPDIASYHSCYGEWRVFLHNGTCSLKNPFSKVTLTLPNLCCHCPIDEPVEIINGRCNPEENMPQQSLDMSAGMSIYKLIVCSKLLVVSIVSIRPRNTIALCRPGADSWLVSGLGNKRMLFDMVFSGGKLYVIDEDKDLLAIEIEEDSDSGKLRISQIKRLIEGRTASRP